MRTAHLIAAAVALTFTGAAQAQYFGPGPYGGFSASDPAMWSTLAEPRDPGNSYTMDPSVFSLPYRSPLDPQ